MNLAEVYHVVNRAKAEIPYRLLNGYALPPVLTQIELTYICNIRCEFCQFFQFQEDNHDWGPTPNELKLDEILKIVDEAPGQVLSFSGGEPLGRRDIKQILGHAAKSHRVHIITNGTFLNEAMTDFLADIGAKNFLRKGLYFLEMSIHGIGEVHDTIVKIPGSYKKAMTGMERLLERKKQLGRSFPKTTIKMVVVQKNHLQILELYKKATEMGTDLFNLMCYQQMEAHYIRFKNEAVDMAKQHDAHFNHTDGYDWREMHAQLTEIQRLADAGLGPQIRWTPIHMDADEVIRYYLGDIDIKEYKCHSPWSKLYISAFGDMLICPYTTIGNIRETTMKEAWNNHISKKFRQELKEATIFASCVGCCNMEYHGGPKTVPALIPAPALS